MEKTYTKQNVFHYIADFFRSIGESAKAVFATDIEEEKEGLEAFDASKLSKENAKILATLQASQQREIAGIEKEQVKRTEAIDYPNRGKNFKNGMKAEEQEAELEEAERGEESEERELD